MIKLITEHHLAEDSDDHHHPDGVHLDNHFNLYFADSVEKHFNSQKISMLDLGCAGGALVSGMIERGHTAVGLEGSDHCINFTPDVILKLGNLPLGFANWKNYHNTNLFTCDITYDYEIQNNNELMQFDLITCFDVMEHFYENRIDKFLEMVHKHLKPNGIFVASIALFYMSKDKILEEGQVHYHKSVFPREKWLYELSKYFNQVQFPFVCDNRGHAASGDEWILVYAGTKK